MANPPSCAQRSPATIDPVCPIGVFWAKSHRVCSNLARLRAASAESSRLTCIEHICHAELVQWRTTDHRLTQRRVQGAEHLPHLLGKAFLEPVSEQKKVLFLDRRQLRHRCLDMQVVVLNEGAAIEVGR